MVLFIGGRRHALKQGSGDFINLKIYQLSLLEVFVGMILLFSCVLYDSIVYSIRPIKSAAMEFWS